MATGFTFIPNSHDGTMIPNRFTSRMQEVDDRKRGYKDTMRIIHEMESLRADWDWASDWINYNIYNDESRLYMSGVYKAFEDMNLDY